MQSTDIFTVGGSISVNAHGMDHRAGSVGRTIRAMRVMLAGRHESSTVSRTEDARLFHLVVGGYGLFGVILDVELDVVANVVYQSERGRPRLPRVLPALDLAASLPDPSFGLLYGHLSTAPQSLLQRDDALHLSPGRRAGRGRSRRSARSARSSCGGSCSTVEARALAMRLKWFAEKHIEPLLESCTVSRNQAMGEGEACLVSRNEPMHDSVPYLRNDLPDETDILHEYFIPQDRFVPFVDGLREIVRGAGRQPAERLGARRAPRRQRPDLRAGRRHARGRALSQPDDRPRRATSGWRG